MLRSVAITRISEGLGFRSGFDARIALRLQEAQRDLESGKTLPKFLLQEDQTLLLAAAAHTAVLPTGFIRAFDDEDIHYTPSGSTIPTFLQRKNYKDAVVAQLSVSTTIVRAPSVYVLRKSVVDFITTADQAYALSWSYYKKDVLLDSDIENAWLLNAPDWLIGEAGWRLAMDLRDQMAVQIFDTLRKSGRAACFGEIIASEEADGPFVMGSDN